MVRFARENHSCQRADLQRKVDVDLHEELALGLELVDKTIGDIAAGLEVPRASIAAALAVLVDSCLAGEHMMLVGIVAYVDQTSDRLRTQASMNTAVGRLTISGSLVAGVLVRDAWLAHGTIWTYAARPEHSEN